MTETTHGGSLNEFGSADHDLSKGRIYLQDYSEQGEDDDEGEPDANDNWVYRVLVRVVSLVSLLCLATLAIDVAGTWSAYAWGGTGPAQSPRETWPRTGLLLFRIDHLRYAPSKDGAKATTMHKAREEYSIS